MLRPRRAGERRRPEQGFTLIEMVVALAIMSVALGVFGTVFVTMTHASTKGQALVTNEQGAELALESLSSDLRAANPVVALPTLATCPATTPGCAYTSAIELQRDTASGSAQTVEWVFDSVAHTLTREVLTAPGGSVSSSAVMLRGLSNSLSQPLFSLYDANNNDLVGDGAAPETVATCATRVRVNIDGLTVPTPYPYNVTADVSLRNASGGSSCP